MGRHVGASVGSDVYDHASAGWSQWTLVEVKVAIQAGVGGELGLAPRGAEEVEGDAGLGH